MRLLFNTLFSILFLGLTYSSSAQCPTSIAGYSYMGEFEDSHYFLSEGIAKWPDAQTNANTVGGYLASISSEEENDFIYNNISNNIVFIGLSDAVNEGTYQWDSGEPVTYNNFSGVNFSSSDYGKINFWNGAWGLDVQTFSRKYIVEIPCNGTGGGGSGLQVNCDFGLDQTGIIPTDPSGTTVSWNEPTATTDCSSGVVTIEQISGDPSGSFFPTGQQGGFTIQYRITGDCGNEEFCTLNFTVFFVTGGIICPDDIMVDATSSQGAQVFFDDPEIAPTGCIPGDFQVISGLPSGSTFPIGTTEVEFLSFFGGSNTFCQIGEVCSFMVTVNDDDGGGGGGNDCPSSISGFTSIGEFGDSKYFISEEEARPTDAQNIAEANDANLVTINSQAENDFIQQNINGLVYIGLNDENVEEDLVWFNGESFDFDNIDPCIFCNANADNQDYGVMNSWDGTWSFSNFYNKRKYVIEVACDGNGGGGGGSSCNNSLAGFSSLGEFGGSEYFLSDDDARPLDAQASANANGGFLATIDTDGENEFLANQINGLVYIGLNDYDVEGNLEWSNGNPVGFTNFEDDCSFCNENEEEFDFVALQGWNGKWSWSNFYNSRQYIVEVPCDPSVTTLFALPTPVENKKPTVQKVVPNPTIDYLYTEIFSQREMEINIQIFDARGLLVKSKKVNLMDGNNLVSVDIIDLAGGFYFLNVPEAQGKFATQRFIKVGE